MPTNLPPEYNEADQRYREASTIEEKISRLEEMISTVPKHKGTDKLRADLRRRLSRLKESAQTRQKVSRHVSAFHVDREGAGQVAVIGSPNVGKSALVTALTNASPEVAEYPCTTWAPTPGMMFVKGIPIQLIDTPPVNVDYVEPALVDLIRCSDLILLVLDLQTDPIGQLEDTLAFLADHRIAPNSLKQRFEDVSGFTFRPMLIAVNKDDEPANDEDLEIVEELLEFKWPLCPVSATTGRNLDCLEETVIERLNLIRVYAKPPGKEPDLNEPFVLREGGTLEEFAGKVHQDFLVQFKSARIWGSGAFDGQMVGRDHVLQEGDIVEIRI